jgi:hypothetical protein
MRAVYQTAFTQLAYKITKNIPIPGHPWFCGVLCQGRRGRRSRCVALTTMLSFLIGANGRAARCVENRPLIAPRPHITITALSYDTSITLMHAAPPPVLLCQDHDALRFVPISTRVCFFVTACAAPPALSTPGTGYATKPGSTSTHHCSRVITHALLHAGTHTCTHARTRTHAHAHSQPASRRLHAERPRADNPRC